MKDPFFLAPIPWVVDWAQPLCDRLGLSSLPLHLHEVFAAFLFYSLIFHPLSPMLSSLLVPQHYAKLPRSKRLSWDVHVVSMVQSTLISALATWIILADDERRNMNWEQRIWGYTGAAGMIQAFAVGYFAWDLVVTARNLDVFGLGALAHAIAALLVYTLGYRPFINYYGCIFILWELSTPFLNIHWFMDKVGMTGSRAQLYNGFALLFTFFCCRLLYGSYQSVLVARDIWAVVNRQPSHHSRHSPTMVFAANASIVPPWLAALYFAGNLTLNSLNFYWFFMMIAAVRKRFKPTSRGKVQAESEVNSSSVSTSLSSSSRPQKRRP